MGYTHYFEFKRVKGQTIKERWCQGNEYQRAVTDMQRIIRRYQADHGGLQGYSAHCAIGRYAGIGFNGSAKDGNDCDDFALREYLYQNEPSQWVKTRRLPYDVVVVACLAVLKHRLGDAVSIGSDGDAKDWTSGVALARQVTGLKINNPIKTKTKAKQIENTQSFQEALI